MSSPCSGPWSTLGVEPGSSVAEARLARRRLAKRLHPDVHGGQADLSAQMTAVNQALAQIETFWENGAAPVLDDAAAPVVPVVPEQWATIGDSVDQDSFSIPWLPVDAFEALFLAAYGLGDILVADEPYLLELYLNEPACFCQLTLVPEAGASLVTVDVSPPAESLDGPSPGAVIQVLVAELHALSGG